MGSKLDKKTDKQKSPEKEICYMTKEALQIGGE